MTESERTTRLDSVIWQEAAHQKHPGVCSTSSYPLNTISYCPFGVIVVAMATREVMGELAIGINLEDWGEVVTAVGGQENALQVLSI